MYFKDLLAYPVLLVDDKASAMWSDEISTAQLLPRDLTLTIFVHGIAIARLGPDDTPRPS